MQTETTLPTHLSTGISQLDDLLNGGFPYGYTTILFSEPGTSAEILIKQIASHQPTIYVSTEEDYNELQQTLERFSWPQHTITFIDISHHHRNLILRKQEADLETYHHRKHEDLQHLIQQGSHELPRTTTHGEDYLAVISNALTTMEHGQSVIIDSLDFLLKEYPPEKVIKTIYALKTINKDYHSSLLFTITRGIHSKQLEHDLETLADCVIDLSFIQHGSAIERLLTIKKMRNYAQNIGLARYTVKNDGFHLDTIQRIL